MDTTKTITIFMVYLIISSCGMSRYAANQEYDSVEDSVSHKGILEECFYDCSGEGPDTRRMFVYLPEDYHESEDRYPVLYLLHGARGNETSWIIKGDLLHMIDSLTDASQMQKTIVVLPNMNNYKNEKDFGKSRKKSAIETFLEVNGNVESVFVEDVVKTVDSVYRTIPDKAHRAIAGLSIGGMQAMHISANYPDIFDYVGMFSAMVHPVPGINGDRNIYKGLKQKQELQFDSPPKLYTIMIGKSDFFYPRMKSFKRQMDRKGYPVELRVSQGGHDWYNWEEYISSFMQRLWIYPLHDR